MMTETTYKEPVRVHTSMLAPIEKRCLVWMAYRLPQAVNSDHLTALAGISMFGAGLCYWNGSPAALIAAVVLLGLNWFGDSLDGTVARVRHHERPRYGFYVDHVLDVLSLLFIFAGLAFGGHMSPLMAGGFLVSYYLLMVEIALATHSVGTFRISYWKFGPTELRIVLAIGTLQLLRSGGVSIDGSRYLLFDLGAAVVIPVLALTFLVSFMMNIRTLYAAEPLPRVPTPVPLPTPVASGFSRTSRRPRAPSA